MNEAFPDALPAGHRLHWYVIERVLGQGGFGITHLALDTNLAQYVAIKEYLPAELARRRADATVQPRTEASAGQYAWGLDRFLAEARTLARFDHPNIVRVVSVFEANGTAYMVMRFEEGEDLATRLERCGTLDEHDLMGFLLLILDGLRLVHEAGYIHRDIKPENIYLRHDGSPVLLDFGSARQSMGQQKTVTILVAPGYAPLEQYDGDAASQGPWTDIYGLGATCYRAITGQAPMDAVARAKGVLGSTREILKPASEIGGGRYSPRLLAAIDWALQLTEHERPQSIAQWRRALVGTGDAPQAAPVPVPPAPVPVDLPASPLPLAVVSRTPLVRGAIVGAGTLAAGAAVLMFVRLTGAPTPPLANVASAPPALPAQASAADNARPASEAVTRRPLPLEIAQPAPPRPAASSSLTGIVRDTRPTGPAPTPPLKQTPAPVSAQVSAAAAAPLPAPMPALAVAPVPTPALAPATSPTSAFAPPSPTAQRPPAGSRNVPDEQLADAEAAINRREFAAAADLLTPLAQAGVSRAQALLGRAHEGRSDRLRSDFEAYLWYGIAARGGDGTALLQRDRVAARLQPAEVRQANQIIERWKPGETSANAASSAPP
ncbi:hypothetical protein BH11PSE10_BH11PSE10_19140 [soil metagenome]